MHSYVMMFLQFPFQAVPQFPQQQNRRNKRLPYFSKNLLTAIPVPANSFKKDWTEICAYVCKTLNFYVFFQLHSVHLSILFFLELLTLSNSKMYPKQIKVVLSDTILVCYTLRALHATPILRNQELKQMQSDCSRWEFRDK